MKSDVSPRNAQFGAVITIKGRFAMNGVTCRREWLKGCYCPHFLPCDFDAIQCQAPAESETASPHVNYGQPANRKPRRSIACKHANNFINQSELNSLNTCTTRPACSSSKTNKFEFFSFNTAELSLLPPPATAFPWFRIQSLALAAASGNDRRNNKSRNKKSSSPAKKRKLSSARRSSCVNASENSPKCRLLAFWPDYQNSFFSARSCY